MFSQEIGRGRFLRSTLWMHGWGQYGVLSQAFGFRVRIWSLGSGLRSKVEVPVITMTRFWA